jgi:hypothetical protein
LRWGRGLALSLSLALSGAAAEKKVDVHKLLEGGWVISAVGERSKPGVRLDSFSSDHLLITYDGVKREFSGRIFGFPIVESRMAAARLGDQIVFTLTYADGRDRVQVHWYGDLSKDGTRITDGKFSCLPASGTFTAVKQGTETREDPRAADAVPEEAQGFRGAIVGEVLHRGEKAAIVKVVTVKRTATESTARRAEALVGQRVAVVLPESREPGQLATLEYIQIFFKKLALGGKETFIVINNGEATLALDDLTTEQLKLAERIAQMQ